MIALIAGTGDLPGLLAARLTAAGAPPLVCALRGHEPVVPPGLTILPFRLETLGQLLADLAAQGVTRVCLAGAVRRPVIDPAAIDALTRPLIPGLVAAMGQGDDGALRAIVSLFEARGFTIIGAAEILPDLLPAPGVPTRGRPDAATRADLGLARDTIARMGRADQGQACVIRAGQVIAEEGRAGTDAMLLDIPSASPRAGFLYKAPKPGQEMRVDMPLIGPETADFCARAGLAGIVIGPGVMLLAPAETLARLDAAGLFLWVAP